MAEAAKGVGVAVLADCAFLIEAQDIGGKAPEAGEDAGVGADTRLVFVEGDIAQMMVAVFDAPVIADGLACLVGVDELARLCIGPLPSARESPLPSARER